MGQTPSADLPPIDDEPEETLPPPHRAVRKQDITSLAVYMYDSEDMKTVDRSGNTPFAYALRLGLDQIALYMIEHFNGIDPNQLIHLPNGESEPVIRYARRMQYSALVVSMFRRGAVLDDTEGALALAVQADNEALVIQLLDNNADPNERALGTTMLHLALRSRSLGIIRALLDRRADVNVYDDALAQPLYRAVELGSLPMTRILLEAAADPNAYAHGPGGSAVHLAAKHAYTGLLCLLIDFGGSRFLSNEVPLPPSWPLCHQPNQLTRLHWLHRTM